MKPEKYTQTPIESQRSTDPLGKHGLNSGGDIVVRRGAAPARRVNALPMALTATPDPAGLLRALHRRLALGLGLALVVSGLVGAAAWFVLPPAEYTARTVLQVNAQIPSLMFAMVDNQSRGSEDYKRYQSNQIGLIQSHLVLNAALSSFEWKKFQTFAREQDPVEYLKSKLLVSFPNGSELLEIKLSGKYPDEIATIVNRVSDAYQEEVVNFDHKRRLDRKDALERTYREQFDELRRRYDEKKRLAEVVGTEDPETIAKKQQLQDQALSDLRREAMQIRLARQKLEAERDVQRRLTTGVAAGRGYVTPEQLDRAVASVASVADLTKRYTEASAKYRGALAHGAKILRNPANDPYVRQCKEESDRLHRELVEEQNAVRPLVERQLADAAIDAGSDELMKLDLQVAALLSQEKALNEEIAGQASVMHRINQDSLEIKDKQRDIDQLDKLNSMIQEEVAKLEVELQAPKRVREIEKASVPQEREDMKRRLLLAGLVVGAFFSCLGLVSVFEFRSRRLNTAEDVEFGLGIQLVGSLPPLPARVRRSGMESPDIEHSEWYRVMLESIDTTRTMIVHEAQAEKLRILLVTSALGGEGKTSLSCHLATSLARAGYRVLLVDSDLRSPAVYRVFGSINAPGLSEVLRGEIDLDDAFQRTSVAELTLLSAGECDDLTLRTLAKGGVTPIFAKLRERFEFIIVDSAPVLPVADTQILAPHVDAVVFSTLRDVSRLPKVFAAHQRLVSLGVRILGAVVTGVSGGLFGHDPGYGYGYPYPRRKRQPSPSAAEPNGGSVADV